MRHLYFAAVLVVFWGASASAQSVSVSYTYPPMPDLDAPGGQYIWTGPMNNFEHFIVRHGIPLGEPYFGEGISDAETWLAKASGSLLDVSDLALPAALAAQHGLDPRSVRINGLTDDGRFVGCAANRASAENYYPSTQGFFWEPAVNFFHRLLARDIVPGGAWMCPRSTNDAGHIVGDLGVGGASKGFLLAPDRILAGYQVGSKTRLTGVNQAGDFVGTFEREGRVFGFVQTSGQQKLIDSTRVYLEGRPVELAVLHVMPAAINSAGEVVGTFVSNEACPGSPMRFMVQDWITAGRCVRSFYYARGEFHLIAPRGLDTAPTIRVTGINDKGWIVGWYDERNQTGDIGKVFIGIPRIFNRPTLKVALAGQTGNAVTIRVEAMDPADRSPLQGKVFEAGRFVANTFETMAFTRQPAVCFAQVWPGRKQTCIPSPMIVKQFEVRVEGHPNATITWRY